MLTETLEESAQEETLIKCSAYFCDRLVETSNLGTDAFRGYEDPTSGRIYCCQQHHTAMDIKERMMQE
jgi:hypothetical protein